MLRDHEVVEVSATPKLNDDGCTSAVAVAARIASTLPAPTTITLCASPCAVETIADLIRSAVQSGSSARSSAATPATCGVAIDVPLCATSPPLCRAESTMNPGAATSA